MDTTELVVNEWCRSVVLLELTSSRKRASIDLMLVFVSPSLPGWCIKLRKSELVQVDVEDGAGGTDDRSPAPLHLPKKTLRRGGKGGGSVSENIADDLDPPILTENAFGGRFGAGKSRPPSAMASTSRAHITNVMVFPASPQNQSSAKRRRGFGRRVTL